MKIFPVPHGPFSRQPGFIPAGRGKAATRSCRRRFVPWVAAFLLACQAGRAGKERAWNVKECSAAWKRVVFSSGGRIGWHE
ncbi:MAG: hypothetical protein BHW66_03355 [Akkermansia sp. 54_46]|nr:hypothetical protein [Akkermansia muciniphila]OLA90202.1 MAG: hypothetical protein BHW66_03355 [Akkermansia sp. 54_46]